MRALKLICGNHTEYPTKRDGSRRGRKVKYRQGDILSYDAKKAEDSVRYKIVDVPDDFFGLKDKQRKIVRS